MDLRRAKAGAIMISAMIPMMTGTKNPMMIRMTIGAMIPAVSGKGG
jgi:hypothetical protein